MGVKIYDLNLERLTGAVVVSIPTPDKHSNRLLQIRQSLAAHV